MMRWPWSSTTTSSSDDNKDNRAATALARFTDSEVLLPTAILTGTTLGGFYVYKRYLRRIPSINYIKPNYYRKRSLFGTVVSVGDADNFRIFHTPGGRLTGWGWLPGRSIPRTSKEYASKTIHIRIAGVDAPEMAHFGRPAQPFSTEAYDLLKSLVLHRRVRCFIHRRDQYDRVVATVYTRTLLPPFRKDVGYEMLKRGLATVYEAKTGAEFSGLEKEYRAAEEKAKERGLGLWSRPSLLSQFFGRKAEASESPREYKTRMAKAESQSKKTQDAM